MMSLRAILGLVSALLFTISAPAGAQTADAVRAQMDALVRADAQGWFFNRYDGGSMTNVMVDITTSDGRSADIRGHYTYNGGAKGWVLARITNGQFDCVEFWDVPDRCRSARYGATVGEALAQAVVAFAASGRVAIPDATPPPVAPQLAAPLAGGGLPGSLREAIRDRADDIYVAHPDGWLNKLRIFSTQPDIAEVECIVERTSGPVARLVSVGDQTCRGTIDLRTGIFEQRAKTGTADGCVDWPLHTDRILGAEGPPPWKQAAAMNYCQQYYIEYAPGCGRINCGAWANTGQQWRSQIFVGREAALAFAGN